MKHFLKTGVIFPIKVEKRGLAERLTASTFVKMTRFHKLMLHADDFSYHPRCKGIVSQ